jgi:hypothetical protein
VAADFNYGNNAGGGGQGGLTASGSPGADGLVIVAY